MAITKIIKVKANPKACIKYVTNPNKTNDKLLVSCVGCTEQNAPGVFNLALMGNGQKALDEQVVKAYHFIQSFATNDEVTPEEAHQIGMDFMKRTFDDKYAFVCSTHVDKGHIHNHFVMCAAARDMSGRKLDDNLSLLHKIRNTNDAICKEHGLSVIDKEKGKSKSYKEWLADKQNPTGSNKIKLRKLIDKTIIEATDFDDFLKKISNQGIELSSGTSKKYGTVTKYKSPDEKHFHRGYSLGTFYGDESIKKRIDRHIAFLKSQEEKKEKRKEQARIKRESMSPAERKLDKSKVKIKSIRDQDFQNITKDSIGKLRWTNKQNAMRLQQISDEVKTKYGISYTYIKGQISSLRADNNRLSGEILKSKKEAEELREFIENCVTYKCYKIYSIHESKAMDKEKYYGEHDTELDAFHDAVFALERRNIDLDSITSEGIKTMQNRLKEVEEEIQKQEDLRRQNERDLKELSDYQKEIDLYLGRKNDEI